jgi:hypothetical protein
MQKVFVQVFVGALLAIALMPLANRFVPPTA